MFRINLTLTADELAAMTTALKDRTNKLEGLSTSANLNINERRTADDLANFSRVASEKIRRAIK